MIGARQWVSLAKTLSNTAAHFCTRWTTGLWADGGGGLSGVSEDRKREGGTTTDYKCRGWKFEDSGRKMQIRGHIMHLGFSLRWVVYSSFGTMKRSAVCQAKSPNQRELLTPTGNTSPNGLKCSSDAQPLLLWLMCIIITLTLGISFVPWLVWNALSTAIVWQIPSGKRSSGKDNVTDLICEGPETGLPKGKAGMWEFKLKFTA